jgi:hypothetical protein
MDTLGTAPEMSNFDCLPGRAGATPNVSGPRRPRQHPIAALLQSPATACRRMFSHVPVTCGPKSQQGPVTPCRSKIRATETPNHPPWLGTAVAQAHYARHEKARNGLGRRPCLA